MPKAVISSIQTAGEFACFVPRCAPPPVGTGGSGGHDAVRHAIKRMKLAKVRESVDGITSSVRSAAKGVGAKMVGLKFRYKSVKSMARKIDQKMIDKGLSVEAAEDGITDALRYTMVIPTGNYVKGVKDSLRDLRKSGFRVVESQSKWVDGDPYAGHHVLLESKSGEVVELQFHTPQSHRVKEKYLHPLYEKERVLPKPDSAQFKSLPKEEQEKVQQQRDSLMERMWAAAKKIPTPPRVTTLPEKPWSKSEKERRTGPRPQRRPRRKLSKTIPV